MKKILRVFPERTSMTPIDDMVMVGSPGLLMPEADEVHISCVFSWNKEYCEKLKYQYEAYYPNVKIGGPAFGHKEDKFTAGMYLKKGITITSRGCNMGCEFCHVNRIEGRFREINIEPGNIIQDNNILLSSKKHLDKVFEMLKHQHAIEFRGGIDCRLLKDWHVEALKGLRISEIWIALDDKKRWAAYEKACNKLVKAGFKRHKIRTYVLVGFNEPILNATDRLEFAYKCGSLPFAQIYQEDGKKCQKNKEETDFIRLWSRPAAIQSHMKKKGDMK